MIIEGNGGVFARDQSDDGMKLWGLRGHVIIQNGTIENCRTGFDIRDCTGVLEFRNVTVKAGPQNEGKWSRAFLCGYPGDNSTRNGLIILRNCTVESIGPPSGDYKKFNRDNLQLEECLPGLPLNLLCEDTYFGGATDACCDVKGDNPNIIKAMFARCTFGPAHRALRAWNQTEVFHYGCTWLRGSHEQVWKQGADAKVTEL